MIKENVIESSPCNVLRGYLDIRCPEEVADEAGLKKDFSLLIALCLPQTTKSHTNGTAGYKYISVSRMSLKPSLSCLIAGKGKLISESS